MIDAQQGAPRAGRGVLLLVAVAALAAIVWGAVAGAKPEGQRPPIRVTPVDAAWYAALPIDPVAATQAFIDRVPADARASAESYNRQSVAMIVLRIVVLFAGIVVAIAHSIVAGDGALEQVRREYRFRV